VCSVGIYTIMFIASQNNETIPNGQRDVTVKHIKK
jgi:hypothetical protein